MTLSDRLADRIVTFLLVEDHEVYRAGLRRLIEAEQDWVVVGEAGDAEEALRLAAELRPQVAIVDLRLRGSDGLDAVHRIREADKSIRILVSSVKDETLYADRCLQAGASGYVEKNKPASSVQEAIKRLLSGGIYLSEQMTERMVARPARRGMAVNALDTLTPRESEVYLLIGQGLSVKQIAGNLALSPKTVEYHRQQMKKKLNLGSSAALNRHAVANALEAPSAADREDEAPGERAP
ncbi:MAG TPA: response regulator transcription factor [Pirellulaceae bacterium]|nr:response regulator transcription factor [Pirellulaceae bacterium]